MSCDLSVLLPIRVWHDSVVPMCVARFRLRRRLEQIRRIVRSRSYRSRMLKLIPGGLEYIRTDLTHKRRRAVRPVLLMLVLVLRCTYLTRVGLQVFDKARQEFRALNEDNRPTCECPKCKRGFALRRDRRAHVRSRAKICLRRDYMDVPEPYPMLDRRPGNVDDYAGTFFSDDSEPSASDDAEVQM